MLDDIVMIDRIQAAFDSGTESNLDELTGEFTFFLFQREELPERVFEFIISLLADCKFWDRGRAWYVLRLLHNDWDRLKPDHKRRIMPRLEAAFRITRDDMSWFLIAILLGEGFANQEAFDILSGFKSIEVEAARSFIPTGFEEICRNATDRGLADRARHELLQMRNDTSWEVRREVDESLRRLSRCG